MMPIHRIRFYQNYICAFQRRMAANYLLKCKPLLGGIISSLVSREKDMDFSAKNSVVIKADPK